MESDYNKKGKTTAIVAYITLIGTIIAMFMNQEPNKNQFASFHIRQAFGLWVTFYLFIAIANIFRSGMIHFAFYIFCIVLIIYGLITAAKEEQKEVPFLGKYFQEWFTFIK